MNRSNVIAVTDPTHVGVARREAATLAQSCQLGPELKGKIEIVVTEAATNLLKHAGQGTIILRSLDANFLEVLAVDKGPGMVDVNKCLADGFSTAGSAGTGLGAISRLAQKFDIYSQPGQGTVLLAQFYGRRKPSPLSPMLVGVVCAPILAGEECGDNWLVKQNGQRSQMLVVDGLGHGIYAAQAADRAVEAFRELAPCGPGQVVQSLHGPLRSTRGASLAVADVDHANGVVNYSGVGNIGGTILTCDDSRSLVSHNGTVGHELHRVQEFQYPWKRASLLVMHSDGLLSRWKLSHYPGLSARHPGLIAAVLFRDFQRGRDDVTVFVAREAAAEGDFR